jgi:hypothetical protein
MFSASVVKTFTIDLKQALDFRNRAAICASTGKRVRWKATESTLIVL